MLKLLLRLDRAVAPGIEILLLRLRVERRHHRLVGGRGGLQGVRRLQELRRGRVGVHAVLLEREAVLAVIVAVGGVAGCKWKWKWKGNEESG